MTFFEKSGSRLHGKHNFGKRLRTLSLKTITFLTPKRRLRQVGGSGFGPYNFKKHSQICVFPVYGPSWGGQCHHHCFSKPCSPPEQEAYFQFLRHQNHPARWLVRSVGVVGPILDKQNHSQKCVFSVYGPSWS